MFPASSPLTVPLLVIVLSFVGAIISDKFRLPYPPVIIAIGFMLSLLRFGGGFGSIASLLFSRAALQVLLAIGRPLYLKR